MNFVEDNQVEKSGRKGLEADVQGLQGNGIQAAGRVEYMGENALVRFVWEIFLKAIGDCLLYKRVTVCHKEDMPRLVGAQEDVDD